MISWLLAMPSQSGMGAYAPDGSGNPVWQEEYDQNGTPIPAPESGADWGNNDLDLLPNWLETYLGTDPYDCDSDDDAATDSDEYYTMGTHPLEYDTNQNGVSDLQDWLEAQQLRIWNEELPTGHLGAPYHVEFSPGGGAGNYQFSLIQSDLPPSFQLTQQGILTGTFGTNHTGNYAFTVQLSDGVNTVTKGFTISAVLQPLQITTGESYTVTVGQPFSFQLTAQGGIPASYSWSIEGYLPDGVQLQGDVISGTLYGIGTNAFALLLSDDGTSESTLQAFTLAAVEDPNPPQASLSLSAELPTGYVYQSYYSSLSASGGQGGYTYALSSGQLPTGMSLSPEGVLSGTPEATGQYILDFTVTDSSGATASASTTLAIEEVIVDPDSDGDGLLDSEETQLGTNLYLPDTDGDFLTDYEEVVVFAGATIHTFNPLNGYSATGLQPDYYVATYTGLLVDTDGGGIPDRLELHYGLDSQNPADEDGDADSDGYSNVEEYDYGFDILGSFNDQFDRDGDGMTTVWEIANGTNPRVADGAADLDRDWMTNYEEFLANTDPRDASSGAATENCSSFDHESEDWDSDGVTNADEIYGEPATNPRVTEDDGGGGTEDATEEPTEDATEEPTEDPTENSTEMPTEDATEAPTEEPTEDHTEYSSEDSTEEATEDSSEDQTDNQSCEATRRYKGQDTKSVTFTKENHQLAAGQAVANVTLSGVSKVVEALRMAHKGLNLDDASFETSVTTAIKSAVSAVAIPPSTKEIKINSGADVKGNAVSNMSATTGFAAQGNDIEVQISIPVPTLGNISGKVKLSRSYNGGACTTPSQPKLTGPKLFMSTDLNPVVTMTLSGTIDVIGNNMTVTGTGSDLVTPITTHLTAEGRECPASTNPNGDSSSSPSNQSGGN